MAAAVDYHRWQKHVWWIYGAVILLLVLCFVPGIGMEVNNEKRWISARLLGISAIQLQPSELAKLAVAILLAHWFAMHPDCGKRFLKGFFLPSLFAGVLIGLVLFEVDMGTAAILTGTFFLLLFVAGVNWKYLGLLAGGGVAGLIGMLQIAPDRMARIVAFMDIEGNKREAAFQQWIGLMALGSGGMDGRGLGSGRLKMLYMPFAHTDFIFPMVGEELGLRATLLVVFAFVLVAVAGITIAFHAPDRFGMLLGLGLVCFIVLQAMLNIGVTTAVLPNTGLPLPFVSYGGSSLLGAMAAVGILLNVYRQGRQEEIESRFWVRGRRITPRV